MRFALKYSYDFRSWRDPDSTDNFGTYSSALFFRNDTEMEYCLKIVASITHRGAQTLKLDLVRNARGILTERSYRDERAGVEVTKLCSGWAAAATSNRSTSRVEVNEMRRSITLSYYYRRSESSIERSIVKLMSISSK